jgi:tripartite-type tricarboxylate transporter receptor subunit TctC
MHTFWHRCHAVLLMVVLSAGTFAADSHTQSRYPDRPVHLIVPFPEGGGADHWGRLVARHLSTALGQTVVVDNMPGQGGNKGTAAAARATPDGYTLLLGSVGPLVVHPFTYRQLDFDPVTAFAPVAPLESSPIVLVASPDVQAASATELIGWARSHPEQLTYASNGDGSPEQVAGELFKTRLQLQIRHLAFDGAGPARKALLAGKASLMFDPCKGALPAVRAGLQRPLAVAATTRLALLPDVPTFAEAGLPGYELRIWTGILAPAGTPQRILRKLNLAIQTVLRTSEVAQEIADEGGTTTLMTPGEFGSFLDAERQRWGALVEESGIPQV